MPIVMVTGGARSGKSSFAENYCKDTGDKVTYIACAIITDDEMAKRIEKHKEQRPTEWATIEQYKGLGNVINEVDNRVFMLDCITTMITNLMFDYDLDYDTCSEDEIQLLEDNIKSEIVDLLSSFKQSEKLLVLVANEVGLGLVPEYRLGRIFRDIAGRMNQCIAQAADEVFFIASGLPIRLK